VEKRLLGAVDGGGGTDAAIRSFHRSVAFESAVLVVVLRAMVVELGA
jgi:hypothetical protein